MPKLPDVGALGGSRTPVSQRGIARVQNAGETQRATYEAAQEAARSAKRTGQMIVEAGSEYLDGQIEDEVAQAETQFLRAKLEADNAFTEDQDYATWSKRYEEMTATALNGAASGISSARVRERFTQRMGLVHLRGIQVMQSAARAKEVDVGRARLTELMQGNLDLALETGDEATAMDLVSANNLAIDAARRKGYIDEEEAKRLGRKQAEDYAVRRLGMLKLDERVAALDNDAGWLEHMPEDWKVEARREAADELEREFLDGFNLALDSYIAGAPVSGEMLRTLSGEEIESNVFDPETKEVLKQRVSSAHGMRRDTEGIASLSPETMMERRQKILNSMPGAVDDAGSAAGWSLAQKRLANFDKVAGAVLEARRDDPAQMAIRSNSDIAETWSAFLNEPTSETFRAYLDGLENEYADAAYPTGSRILPKSFASEAAVSANTQWVTSSEKAAAQIGSLAQAMGKNWTRGFAELIDAGLEPEAAAAGWVQHSPALQQQAVALARNGGLKALREIVPADQRGDADEEIMELMEEARRAAGSENQQFIGAMYDGVRLYAYDAIARGSSPADAARDAVKSVLAANFRVIAGSAVTGMLDPSNTMNEDAIDIGAQTWIDTRLSTPKPVVTERYVREVPGQGWITLPKRFGGSDVDVETSFSLAQRFGFRDPATNEPLTRYESEEAATQAAGSVPTEGAPALIDVHAGMLPASLLQPGLRPEDAQDIARKIIANNARFILSPDGKAAVLVTDAFGLPTEVIAPDGNPIVVPADELLDIGAIELERIRAEKGMRSRNAPQPQKATD